jgi:predicted RNase H-like HicB family nuclease
LSDVIEVQAQWDQEAGVWWAESADLPGLVSEAPTLDALMERVSSVIPDLLAVAEGSSASNNAPRRVTFRLYQDEQPLAGC